MSLVVETGVLGQSAEGVGVFSRFSAKAVKGEVMDSFYKGDVAEESAVVFPSELTFHTFYCLFSTGNLD